MVNQRVPPGVGALNGEPTAIKPAPIERRATFSPRRGSVLVQLLRTTDHKVIGRM